MNRSPIFRLLLLLLILALGLTVVQAQSSGNLLTNPGFEEPFESISGDMPSVVAQGWTAWYLSTDDNLEPEYYPASDTVNGMGTPRIHGGSDAQQYFTFFAAHVGGVYQTVSGITAGTELQFSVYAYVWTSTSDSPDVSDSGSDMVVQVGIDPTGGTDPTSDAIVWSEVAPSYDKFDQYSVTATASGDAVTVYVRSTVNVVAMNNVVYVDDAELVATGGAQVVETAESTTETTIEVPVIEVTAEVEMTSEAVEPTEEVIPFLEVTSEASPEVTDVMTVEPLPTEDMTLVIPVVTEEPTVEVMPTEVVTEMVTVEAPTELPTEVSTEVPTEIPTEVPTEAPTEIPATATPVTPTEVPPTPLPSPTLDIAVFPYSFQYTVVRGDTVAQIATRYGSTVEAIIIANQLDAQAHIFETQLLTIPLTVPLQPTVPPPATAIPSVTPIPTETTPPTSVPLPTETPIVVQGVEPTTSSGQAQVVGTPATTTYVVKYNDTLSTIAARFGTTTRELAQLNGIVNPNIVYVGQVLRIPVSGSPTSTPVIPTLTVAPPTSTSIPVPTVTPVAPHVYQVQPGDNLYRISIRFNVSIAELIRINGIYDASRIYVGQLLILP